MTAAHCTQGISPSAMQVCGLHSNAPKAPFHTSSQLCRTGTQVGIHRHEYGWADNGEHECAETARASFPPFHGHDSRASIRGRVRVIGRTEEG